MTTQFVGSSSHADSLPFSLIEQKSLVSRLVEEGQSAVRDLASDPRAFLKELLSPGTTDAKRRQRIYTGLAIAVIVHVSLLIVIAVVGWRTMFVKHSDGALASKVYWLPLNEPDRLTTESNAPRGKRDDGGGGGGDHSTLPATKGPLPKMSPDPQIVKPNTPSVKLPTIQLPPTIVGPDSSPPPPGIALGIPTGAIAEAPSPGTGDGGGLGGKNGTGAGPGNGAGAGKGGPGGTGDKGRIGSPVGRDDGSGPIPYNLIRSIPNSTGVIWLHRPTPQVTAEAQANKVKGEVWLRATFREDGTITDIEVIREVPFMTESAITSLQRSTFRPATIKGRPVTLLNVPVRINVDVFQR
jgi:hypothetical protein